MSLLFLAAALLLGSVHGHRAAFWNSNKQTSSHSLQRGYHRGGRLCCSPALLPPSAALLWRLRAGGFHSSSSSPRLDHQNKSRSGHRRRCWSNQSSHQSGASIHTVKNWRPTQCQQSSSATVDEPTLADLRGSDILSPGASRYLRNKLQTTSERIDGRPSSRQSYVTSLIEDVAWAFSELGYENLEIDKLEKWAVFSHDALAKQSRSLHRIPRVFQICAGAWPIQLLAASYRDLIMQLIDNGIPEEVAPLVQDVFENANTNGDNSCSILNPNLCDSRDLLIAAVFGLRPGDSLRDYKGRRRGRDMFLSCICASRLFEGTLSLKHTAQLAACMEASIPFRSMGSTPPLETLYNRLEKANTEFELAMQPEELVETVELACDLRNRIMANLLTDSPAGFLRNNWLALLERHEVLRKSKLCFLFEYNHAIQWLLRFLNRIDPKTFFCSFGQVQVPEDSHRYLAHHLAVARCFVGAHVVANGIVSAIAILTGGDAPVSFFFGDPSDDVFSPSSRLGDGLDMPYDSKESTSSGDPDGEQHQDASYTLLLENCRKVDMFDCRQSPLAAILLSSLGCRRLSELAEAYCDAPVAETTAWQLLRSIPAPLAQSVGGEMGRITVSRGMAIEKRVLGKL